MTDDTVTSYLADNPRMTGVLFAILLLLTQAGAVSAAAAGTVSGP